MFQVPLWPWEFKTELLNCTDIHSKSKHKCGKRCFKYGVLTKCCFDYDNPTNRRLPYHQIESFPVDHDALDRVDLNRIHVQNLRFSFLQAAVYVYEESEFHDYRLFLPANIDAFRLKLFIVNAKRELTRRSESPSWFSYELYCERFYCDLIVNESCSIPAHFIALRAAVLAYAAQLRWMRRMFNERTPRYKPHMYSKRRRIQNEEV